MLAKKERNQSFLETMHGHLSMPLVFLSLSLCQEESSALPNETLAKDAMVSINARHGQMLSLEHYE